MKLETFLVLSKCQFAQYRKCLGTGIFYNTRRFSAVDATDSKSLFYAICHVFIRCGLDKKMVLWQRYDGAASVSGN